MLIFQPSKINYTVFIDPSEGLILYDKTYTDQASYRQRHSISKRAFVAQGLGYDSDIILLCSFRYLWGLDEDFENSDHNPVYMNFILK